MSISRFISILFSIVILTSSLFGNGITGISIETKSDKVIVTINTTSPIQTDKISGWVDRVNWLNIEMEGIIPPSNDILTQSFEYPTLDISSQFVETSTTLSIHLAKKITSYDFAFFPDTSMIQVLLFWGDENLDQNGDDVISTSFILPTKEDFNQGKWKHPSSWKEERVRTYVTILCDTPDLPIYVDGIYVGHTPIKHDIDVFPGWHKIGYFPGDPTQMGSPKSPKDKMLDDILRMGILDVYVDEGKTEEIVLTYQSLDEDVYEYQDKVNSGAWIGFSMFFLLIVLLSWGMA